MTQKDVCGVSKAVRDLQRDIKDTNTLDVCGGSKAVRDLQRDIKDTNRCVEVGRREIYAMGLNPPDCYLLCSSEENWEPEKKN
jgi:hypothetical protein